MKGSGEEATKPREYYPPTPPQVHPSSRVSFCPFLDRGGEKRKPCLNRVKPLKSPQPERLDSSVLFPLVKLFGCKHLFIDKLMIITERTAIKPWVRNYIPVTCSACSTKILLDSCTVFLKYAKIEQPKERLC